jgi:P-type Cu+ transporter
MRPEIEQDEPGDRLNCSMTLEPKNLTANTDAAGDAEIRDMTRRFWIGTAMTLPVVILAMVYLVPAPARQSWVDSQISRWLQFALTTPVVLWAG